MKSRTLFAAVLSSLIITACSSSSNSPRAVPAPPATNTNGSPVTAVISPIFNPAASQVPLPINLFFLGTTDLTVNIPVANANNFGDPLVAVNALDGFSTVAPWVFSFSVAPRPSTLLAGQTVRMFEVTLTGPGGAVTSVVRELASPAEFVVGLSSSDPTGTTVGILPTSPLKQLTSYMTVITNGVTDATGNNATPSQTYFLTQRTSPLCVGGVSTDPLLPNASACGLEPLRQLTGAQEVAAAGRGIPRTNVVLSWVATTQGNTPVIQTLRAVTAPATITSISSGFTTAAVGAPPVADIHVGSMPLPYYLNAPTAANPAAILSGFFQARAGGYVAPFNALGLDPTSTHVTTYNPIPVAKSTQTVPVLITVPNAASGRTKPATGWPVVIFQHGISRNRTDALGIAPALAAAGYVVVAIDQPLHGLANTSPFFAPNERTFNADLVNNVTSAPGPDGIADASGAHTINLASLLTSRDNLRQAVADLFVLARSVPNMAISGTSGTAIDGSRVYFVGQSLGSIVGTSFLAFEPTINTAVLSVPGGGIARMLDASPAFGPRIRAGLAASNVLPGTSAYDQFFFATQTVLDSVDPVNFGLANAGKRILLHEVVGGGTVLPDQVIPNSVATAPLAGTEPLIRALGLSSILASRTDNAGIRGAVRFTQGDHGSLLSPAFSAAAFTEMQGQMISMLNSNGTTVTVANPAVIRTQ